MQKTDPTLRLVYDLKEEIPNKNHKASLESLLGLFLEATGNIRIQKSKGKSASSLSRFLNHYLWSTRAVFTQLRRATLEKLLKCRGSGRPLLKVIVDITSIEKRGEFSELEPFMHTLNGVHGVHLSVVYLVMGKERIPWSLRLWKGKGTPSESKLALKQIRQLPKSLLKQHNLIVLADGGYGNIDFIRGLKKLGIQGIIGIRANRKLEDGRQIKDVRYVQKVRPIKLHYDVWATRFRLKGIKGAASQWRYVISTEQLSNSMIKRWGKRRWAIEAFFKTMKHRFGLHCFGQATRLGVYRWFLFCFLAFILAYQAHNSQQLQHHDTLDWQAAAHLAIQLFLPQFMTYYFFNQLDNLIPIAANLGYTLTLSNCNI